jgi:UDP-N-acetylglucosamine 1-carboxyvinyltransferase
VEKFKIVGPTTLSGEIKLDGAKNAALPIFCASLLSSEDLTITNVPKLGDVRTLLELLRSLGVEISENLEENNCTFNAKKLDSVEVPYDRVKTMRASILTLGPLLARVGEARVSLPGGCAIGQRPVDQHIRGLKKMGAEISLKDGYVVAKARRLKGAIITNELITVTGTANLMMAACLADGTTIIENAAKEPEIVDLAGCLKSMGAEIDGAGTEIIRVEGVNRLHAGSHEVISDRIEAGTFMCAVAACGGGLYIKNFDKNIMGNTFEILKNAGGSFAIDGKGIFIKFDKRPIGVSVRTDPFPGFATDMQAQLLAVNTVGAGLSVIEESIFENRFMHVPEIKRMGGNIRVNGRTAIIQGVKSLSGTKLMATDLRASAGLVIAALVAEGESVIDRIYHLDRGYVGMDKKLTELGGMVERINE